MSATDSADDLVVGFVGLGVMGQPMALNLARAGTRLIVWNRSPHRAAPLAEAGATAAAELDEVFAAAGVVIVMLVDEATTDLVLGRGTPDFARRVRGRLVVSTGSVSPRYSQALASDVRAAGGRFVEAPVSGSRGPAEAGTLVAFLGGEPDDAERVRQVLAPTTRETIWCGPVGAGLTMKLAVNHYLNVTVAALAEATHFADRQGLERSLLQRAISAGPMSSEVVRVKLQQLVDGDFDVRAAIHDAYASTRLIADAARHSGTATPLLDLTSQLYREAIAVDGRRRDMVAVIDAVRARTQDESRGNSPTSE